MLRRQRLLAMTLGATSPAQSLFTPGLRRLTAESFRLSRSPHCSRVPFVSLFVVMWHVCNVATSLADLAHQHISTRLVLQGVFNVDELRLGNALGPDTGRPTWAIYWTWLEWPPWFRRRETELDKVHGGISQAI